jgi:hypothetical protein
VLRAYCAVFMGLMVLGFAVSGLRGYEASVRGED